MEKFDEKYYEDLWGTVHRHDFCPGLAKQLVEKHGVGKYLDLGTGCGFMVKCLRDLGCEAWGIDISDHALNNSCARGYVLRGDGRTFPFPDKYFDLVMSHGFLEYTPEAEIPGLVEEMERVGKKQWHNYDTTESTIHPEFKFETVKSHAWWEDALKPPKILIACPVHESKEYAIERWINAVNAIDYPNKKILLVDNSPNLDFMNRWKDKVPMVHLDFPEEGPNRRIGLSMEYIRKYFVAGDYKYWIDIESDIIVPPETFHLLKRFESDWTSHYYPGHYTLEPANGFGCSLFSRKIMVENPFDEPPEQTTTDSWWWHTIVKPKAMLEQKYEVVELYGHLKLIHLSLGE